MQTKALSLIMNAVFSWRLYNVTLTEPGGHLGLQGKCTLINWTCFACGVIQAFYFTNAFCVTECLNLLAYVLVQKLFIMFRVQTIHWLHAIVGSSELHYD